jgi:putative copper resistance protein D
MNRVEFKLHNALTQWQWSPFSLLILAASVAAAYWYLRADWLLASRGRRWSRWRTTSFLAGLVAIVIALCSPVATFTATYFQAHVIQHLLLMVVAAPLLALGAPSTLLLQTARRETKTAWLAVLRSRPFAVLTFPIVVWFLYFGLMFAFFLSSLINVAMHHMWLMDLLNLTFLFGATLYWWPMIGLDPIIHWKMGYGTRMVNVLLGGPPEVILGLAILTASKPIASMYSLDSTHAGGGLLWVATELSVIVAFVPIFWQWTRSEERAAARIDARDQQPPPAPTALVEPEGPPPLTNWEAMWASRTGMVPTRSDDGRWITDTHAAATVRAPKDLTALATLPPAPREPAAANRTATRRRTYRVNRKARYIFASVVGVAVLAVAGPAIYFHVIEGSAPAPLSLPKLTAGAGPIIPGAVSGTWAVGPGSLGGYRVQEILLGQHHTAVGRTPHVTGGVVISGTTVAAADFVIDVGSIKSDQPSRDAQFKGYIMEPYKYPHATFKLTEPIALGRIPPPGQVVLATAVGQLTLRGVTRSVTFPVQAERFSGGIDITAHISITFSEWHIPNPSFAVAQVGNTGTVEVLLDLVRAS